MVAWDSVCQPMSAGGLGIRSLRTANLAAMGKPGWRFLRQRDSLWANVIRGKYATYDIRGPSRSSHLRNGSHVLRGLQRGIHDVVTPGTIWRLGNGRTIRFWLDPWVGHSPFCLVLCFCLSQLWYQWNQMRKSTLEHAWAFSSSSDFTSASASAYKMLKGDMPNDSPLFRSIWHQRDKLHFLLAQVHGFKVAEKQ